MIQLKNVESINVQLFKSKIILEFFVYVVASKCFFKISDSLAVARNKFTFTTILLLINLFVNVLIIDLMSQYLKQEKHLYLRKV